MMVREATTSDIMLVAPLIAKFRVKLKTFKNIQISENITAAQDEFSEYLDAGFPVFLCIEDTRCIGYMACRVDKPTVWVESIFVLDEYRRQGAASLLFKRAEALAQHYGSSTVFNYVHPNNTAMIQFLASHGYTVLNLIEIRKPYPSETIFNKIQVGDHIFDY